MVKRRREDEIFGVIEFPGLQKDDPVVAEWEAQHRVRNGGALRFSRGATGMRVAFSKQADLEWWQQQSAGLKKRG